MAVGSCETCVNYVYDEENEYYCCLVNLDEDEMYRFLTGTQKECPYFRLDDEYADFSRSFHPWEDFSKGLYLAGVECDKDAKAPDGWTKWIIPGYEYIYVECEDEDTFVKTIKYLEENDIPLAGAVHDFVCPQTGKNYMFFPVREL